MQEARRPPLANQARGDHFRRRVIADTLPVAGDTARVPRRPQALGRSFLCGRESHELTTWPREPGSHRGGVGAGAKVSVHSVGSPRANPWQVGGEGRRFGSTVINTFNHAGETEAAALQTKPQALTLPRWRGRPSYVRLL